MARYVPKAAAVEAWQWKGVLCFNGDLGFDCVPGWVVKMFHPGPFTGKDEGYGALWLHESGLVFSEALGHNQNIGRYDWLVLTERGAVVLYTNSEFLESFHDVAEVKHSG